MQVDPTPASHHSAHVAGSAPATPSLGRAEFTQESLQLLGAVLDAFTAGVAILAADGTILAANTAWQACAYDHGLLPEHSAAGTCYLAAVEATSGPQAGMIATGVGAVVRGEQHQFTLEYAVESQIGLRWFALQAISCGTSGWARVVLTHKEITQHKRGEALEAGCRQLLDLVARQQGLEQVVADTLHLIHKHYPDLIYTALIVRDVGLFRAAAPTQTLHQRNLLNSWATERAADPAPPLADGPAILVTSSAEIDWPEMYELAGELGMCCYWRALFPMGSDTFGQFILCRRVALAPSREDIGFIGLVGQIMSIAVEQHERTRRLAHQAHHDALTGLPNRLLFEDRLHQALEAARRTRRLVAVLMIDLDRFKHINDSLGHAVGDALIVQLARRFEGCVRATDTLARRGGDEFMLVLPEISSAQQVTRVARRLHEMLRLPFLIDGHELFVSASIGASLYPADGEDADTLQRSADAAMYRAKNTLRNSFQFFDATVNRAALERLQLENHLRRAIERGELALYYQPKVDRQGQLVGAEALLRWHHPELGQIPPSRFIPLAEELGLIVPIGEWCLTEICRQTRAWQRKGLPLVRVAANVSALQFAQPSFTPTVTQILAQSELDPTCLELELTESMLMGDVEAVSQQLRELRELRLTLAIDDFGTGFSSLVYLQRLPISVLKIDRSFVGRLGAPDDESERGIVSAIVTLAHHLHLEVVAEGVETQAQSTFLHTIGCDLFQGFLFSEPLPPILFEHLLRGGPIPGPLWRA